LLFIDIFVKISSISKGDIMYKIGLFLLILSLSNPAQAQMSYEDEARALGIIAGQGLACGSSKYDTFELLARAIILTKSPNNSLQDKALKIFTEEKANIFIAKQLDNFADCPAIVNRFDEQDIFKATLYGDGTIKMPDGKIITPRIPYDATQIYDKDSNIRQRAASIYNKPKNNIKKLEFKDASIEAGNQIKPLKAKGNISNIVSGPRRISRKK